MSIAVLIVDDHPVVRDGLRGMFSGDPRFTVVGEAGNGADALRLAAEHRPDVVVLDVSMPGESGLRVAPKLREAIPDTRVLIMSMHDNAEYVREGVRADDPTGLLDAPRLPQTLPKYLSEQAVDALLDAAQRMAGIRGAAARAALER